MKFGGNEKGATMVEVIMTLGVIGALGVGIATLVTSMYDRYRVSRIGAQIEELKKTINNRYVADGQYTDISIATLIDEELAPKDMVNNKKLSHAYKGEVTLKGSADSYEITFSDLPQRICVELGIMNWTVDNTSDLVSLDINGKDFEWPWVTGNYKLPAQMADVSVACKSGSANIIKWTFQ